MNAKHNSALTLAIAGGALCLVAFFLFALSGVLIYQSWSIQRGWTPAEAKVLRNRVALVNKRIASASAPTYKTEFDVRYQSGTRVYVATVEAPYHSEDQAQMRAWAAQYPVGATMAVKFNPKNPAKAVFAGDVSYETGTMLLKFGLLAAVIGLALLYYARQRSGIVIRWPALARPLSPGR